MPSIDDFIFLENASFYTLKDELNDAQMNNLIKSLFNDILNKGIEGEKYVDIRRDCHNDVKYSLLAYKRVIRPSCIYKDVLLDKKWMERKFAYLFIVEYERYVVISKRNIPSIKKLRDRLKVVNYETLRSVLVKDNAKFQRFGMSNTDVSVSAMRSKTVEADNLIEVFPVIGANSFKLNSYRMALPQENGEDDELLSVAMNMSRINQIGIRTKWQQLISWIKSIVDAIIAYHQNEDDSFLTIFAHPVDFATEYREGRLIPNSVLFQIISVINDENIINITRKWEENDEEHREDINKTYLYTRFHQAFDVIPHNDGYYYASLGDEVIAKIIVSENGIELHSEILEKIWLTTNVDNENTGNEEICNLLDYIIENGYFVIHFENPYLKYTGNELFKDSSLWDRLDEFLDVFEEDEFLSNNLTEKGTFREGQTSFDGNTLFSFCENKYQEEGKIMICDDLGTEWADHILIGKDSVKLFAAKHKDLCFSASAFQEVVGQVQKNLGVFYPLNSTWDGKREKWSKNYVNSNVQTSIPRVRTEGTTADDAINLWQKALKSANYKRDVYLVIDFISKQRLSDCLSRIKNRENIAEKKEAIPLLWLLSAFISACQNMNIGVHITCRP